MPPRRAAAPAPEPPTSPIRWLVATCLLGVSLALHAQPNAYSSRADAIKGLTAPDAAHRVDAVVWIASNGTAADEKFLRPRLTDDSPMVRELAEQGLWILWARSGDATVDALMEKGAAQMETRQLTDAVATFSEVIRRKPAFAEGWNRRATAYFLAGEFRRSLADCEEVTKRNPYHFGAFAGSGQNWFHLEQYDKAIAAWRRALEINPNLEGIEESIAVAEKLLAQKRRNYVQDGPAPPSPLRA
ncbi:MAG: tetratricopeptide repeat protein [Burkholderiales bacterium]